MVRDVLLVFDNEYIFYCGDFNIVINLSLDYENNKIFLIILLKFF